MSVEENDTQEPQEPHELDGPHGPSEDAAAAPAQRKRWPWIAAVAAVAVAAAGIGIAAALGAFAPAAEPTEAKPATTVTPTPTTTPTPTPAPRTPLTVDIPTVQQMPYTEVWNPPDGGEYFWQIVDPANGYPETGGTSYVLAHACENQSCAGDQLRTLEAGDTITYLEQSYQVQESREIMKTDIAAQDIWYHDPNRLVVITCIIETTWDQSDKNDVIIATRI